MGLAAFVSLESGLVAVKAKAAKVLSRCVSLCFVCASNAGTALTNNSVGSHILDLYPEL